MDGEDLRVFLAVGGAGSLAGGARRLHVSQATAWRRIRSLEAALKVALFERHQSGYVLTTAGAVLMRAVESVPRTIEAGRNAVTHDPATVEGEVRVAAPEFVGILLAGRLPELAARHPGLVVELLTGSPAASLLVRDVDIAFRVERVASAGFVLEETFAVPFGLYASPAYVKRFGKPGSIDALAGHRLIDFDHSIAHVAPKPWLRAAGGGAIVVFRSNSPHARLAAARDGLGLAMLPEPLARGQSGLRQVLSSARVGTLELMMFASAELRREPRVGVVRDYLAGLFRDTESDSAGVGAKR
jgi:DNA-binding transcriptional LysR family regulator